MMTVFTEQFTGTSMPPGWTLIGTSAQLAAQDFSFNNQANLNFHTPSGYISAGPSLIRTDPLGSAYGGTLSFKLVLPNYNFGSSMGGSPVLRTRFGTFPPPGTGSSSTLGLGVEFSKARFVTTWSGVARAGWNTPALPFTFTADLAKPYYRFVDNGTDVSFANSADGVTYTTLTTWAGASVPVQIPDQILRWEGELSGWTTSPNSGWTNPPITTTMVLDSITWEYLAPVTEVTGTSTGQWNVGRLPLSGQFTGNTATFY